MTDTKTTPKPTEQPPIVWGRTIKRLSEAEMKKLKEKSENNSENI